MPSKARSNAPGPEPRPGPRGEASADPNHTLDEFDLAAELKGRNSLHGNDQLSTMNQRQAQAGATGRTDGLLESFAKMDKDVRAETDLGKKRSKRPEGESGSTGGNDMAGDSDDLIRNRAYEIWEAEGRPDGRSAEHWRRAREELGGGPSDLERNPGIGSTRGAWEGDPSEISGDNTFEGDVLNDTNPQGGIDPDQRGRTNR